MKNKFVIAMCAFAASCLIAVSSSQAADEPAKKETFGQKTKSFIQRLFSYPANVLQGSVDTAADAGKRGTKVVVEEVKTVGQIVSGDVDKTKEAITEPLTGTAETVVKTVEAVGQVPVEAAKEN